MESKPHDYMCIPYPKAVLLVEIDYGRLLASDAQVNAANLKPDISTFNQTLRARLLNIIQNIVDDFVSFFPANLNHNLLFKHPLCP